MTDNRNDTLRELLAQTKRIRGVFWGREIAHLGPAALQLLVAVRVADRDGAETTASALAGAIGIAPPAASTELKKLEAEGLVTRTKGLGHHLSRDTQLTPEGAAVVEAVVRKSRNYDSAE